MSPSCQTSTTSHCFQKAGGKALILVTNNVYNTYQQPTALSQPQQLIVHRRAACFPGKNKSSRALEELSQGSSEHHLAQGCSPATPQAPQQRLRTHSSRADQSWHTEAQLHKVQGRNIHPAAFSSPRHPRSKCPQCWGKKTFKSWKLKKRERVERAWSMLACV